MLRALLWMAILALSCQLQARPLQAVYFCHAAPYSYLEQNTPHGILIDMVQAIADGMQIQVAHRCFPWKRAQAMVESGEADVMVTIPTEQRLQYAHASKQHLLSLSKEILAHRHHPAIDQLRNANQLEQLRPYRFVTYLGDGWAQQHLERSGYRIVYEPTPNDVIRLAALNRDLLIPDLQGVALYRARQMGLGKDFEILPLRFDHQDFHLLVSKASPYQAQLPEFDAQITKLRSNGSLQAIPQRHLH